MKDMQLDFIVAGFAKCGTTTLHSLLSQHPDIFMPWAKEPRFFCDENYEQEWPAYMSLFEKAQGDVVRGEASVRYAEEEFEKLSRERILKHYPNIKIVFIARDPVHRIESQYKELHNSSCILGVSCPFDLVEACSRFPGIVRDTLYLQRLNNYRDHLPKENIHVLFLEDFKANTMLELQQVFRFLGVDDSYVPNNLDAIHNKGSTKYRDTELFRAIKQRQYEGESGFTLRHLPYQDRQKIWRRNGWRVPFGFEPVIWPEDHRSIFLGEQLAQESIAFLEKHNKPLSIWPGLQKKLALE